MKLRSSWPEVASTMRSFRGRGKLSFGQARLTSVKSMQSRHLPFAICLFDENYFSQPVGVIYFPDNSGLEEFATSSLIAFCLSGVKLLLFCLTGLKEGLTFSLWVMIAGSIPPISSYFQANTSTFCFKKWMRRSLASSVRLDPM